MNCQHEDFIATTTINRITDTDGHVTNFQVDLSIWCIQCKLPFQFVGLPGGLDMQGAAASPDQLEARLTIKPPELPAWYQPDKQFPDTTKNR